jgi:hypothetical protein
MEIYEEICGARLTTNMGKVVVSEDWSPRIRCVLRISKLAELRKEKKFI